MGSEFQPEEEAVVGCCWTPSGASERHGLVLLFTGDVDGMLLSAGEQQQLQGPRCPEFCRVTSLVLRVEGPGE